MGQTQMNVRTAWQEITVGNSKLRDDHIIS